MEEKGEGKREILIILKQNLYMNATATGKMSVTNGSRTRC
jgi:hypothetical protein